MNEKFDGKIESAGYLKSLEKDLEIEDQKGGPGSGSFGHAGRPGKVGGGTAFGSASRMAALKDKERASSSINANSETWEKDLPKGWSVSKNDKREAVTSFQKGNYTYNFRIFKEKYKENRPGGLLSEPKEVSGIKYHCYAGRRKLDGVKAGEKAATVHFPPTALVSFAADLKAGKTKWSDLRMGNGLRD